MHRYLLPNFSVIIKCQIMASFLQTFSKIIFCFCFYENNGSENIFKLTCHMITGRPIFATTFFLTILSVGSDGTRGITINSRPTCGTVAFTRRCMASVNNNIFFSKHLPGKWRENIIIHGFFCHCNLLG